MDESGATGTHSANRFGCLLHGTVVFLGARALPLPAPSCPFACRDDQDKQVSHHRGFHLFKATYLWSVPLRAAAAAGFLEPVSESESQMDLSGFFALGAGGFLGLGAASEGFLAAAATQKHDASLLSPL